MKSKCECAGQLKKVEDGIKKTRTEFKRIIKDCLYSPHIPYWQKNEAGKFMGNILEEVNSVLTAQCDCDARKKLSFVVDYLRVVKFAREEKGFNALEAFKKLKRIMEGTGASTKKPSPIGVVRLPGRRGSPSGQRVPRGRIIR